MKRKKLFAIVTVVFCILSVFWLLYDFAALSYMSAQPPSWWNESERTDLLVTLVGVGIPVLLLFHIFSLPAIIVQLYKERTAILVSAMALFTGSLSLLLLFSDFVIMQDIYKEVRLGWDTTGEWTILYINHSLHMVFTLLALRLSLSTLKTAENTAEPVLRDEVLFLTAQYIGIACGVLGLAVLVLVYSVDLPGELLFFFSAIVLVPYILAVVCWLAVKLRETSSGWYDEKQFTDIARGAFITMLVLIPCMAAVYSTSYFGTAAQLNHLWFFIYMFLTLGLFSGGTLYFSTRH